MQSNFWKNPKQRRNLLFWLNKRYAQCCLFLEKQAELEQRVQLAAFLQAQLGEEPERPKLKSKGDYEKHIDKYDFKSQSVVEMLKTLKLKFEDEQTAANKAETNSINAYDLAKNSRDEVRHEKRIAKKQNQQNFLTPSQSWKKQKTV